MAEECPFCNVDASRILMENEVGFALADAFPVTQGHTLVVAKRHVASLFDFTADEQAAMWRLAAEVRARLLEGLHPDGFNVGVNDGRAARQTIMHTHIHVIPRYSRSASEVAREVHWE